jgi:hypothetical protein
MLVDKNVLLGPGVIVAIDELRGRAAFMALNKANDKSAVEASMEMRVLSKQSLVKGSPVKLQVYRSGDRHFLRWKHRKDPITWEALQPVLADMPAPVRKHYVLLHRRVLELNAISSMFQGVRTEIQKLMKQAGWNGPAASALVRTIANQKTPTDAGPYNAG